MAHVKQYGIHELCLHARAKKPFDTPLKAHFTAPDGTKITVWGFYDGDDRFLIRFMPEQEGIYTYETVSPLPALHGVTGSFQCAGADGHGKVMPDGLYLKHADGTRHYSVGTTCYAWIYQPDSVRKDTLSELKKDISIRFGCAFSPSGICTTRNSQSFIRLKVPRDLSTMIRPM